MDFASLATKERLLGMHAKRTMRERSNTVSDEIHSHSRHDHRILSDRERECLSVNLAMYMRAHKLTANELAREIEAKIKERQPKQQKYPKTEAIRKYVRGRIKQIPYSMLDPLCQFLNTTEEQLLTTKIKWKPGVEQRIRSLASAVRANPQLLDQLEAAIRNN